MKDTAIKVPITIPAIAPPLSSVIFANRWPTTRSSINLQLVNERLNFKNKY